MSASSRERERSECARDVCPRCARGDVPQIDPDSGRYSVSHWVTRAGGHLKAPEPCPAAAIHLRTVLAAQLGLTGGVLRDLNTDHMDALDTLLDLPDVSGETARAMLQRGDLDAAAALLAPGTNAVRAVREGKR